MIRATSLFALVFLLFVPVCLGQGGELKALLIGNSAYVVDEMNADAQFPPLEPMTRNDVNAVYKALLNNGFQPENIQREYNLGHDSFVTTLANFASRPKPDDKVLFYFSGHGFHSVARIIWYRLASASVRQRKLRRKQLCLCPVF